MDLTRWLGSLSVHWAAAIGAPVEVLVAVVVGTGTDVAGAGLAIVQAATVWPVSTNNFPSDAEGS
jgi:hypothetical protein